MQAIQIISLRKPVMAPPTSFRGLTADEYSKLLSIAHRNGMSVSEVLVSLVSSLLLQHADNLPIPALRSATPNR